jgi:predicted short-subunit dehydrogenase-like oxidoreductase (DUF2520 family)
MTKPRLGFIGAGRVGSVLALALNKAGYPVVAVASRRFESAQSLAGRIDGCDAVHSPQTVVDRADLVFVTTPDDAIRGVAQSLPWRDGVAVVHTSGAETRDALRIAAARGATTASLHPLQTFAGVDQGLAVLPGTVFAVEAEGDLKDTLLTLVTDLQGTPIELRSEDKVLYHAAAVLASNYVVTLMKLASDLWLRIGQERSAAVPALLPLLRGVVANLDALGLPAALTGPIARGDVETVRRHLDAIAAAAPETLPAYRELALQTIPVALARGGLSDTAAAGLRELLDGSPLALERRDPK